MKSLGGVRFLLDCPENICPAIVSTFIFNIHKVKERGIALTDCWAVGFLGSNSVSETVYDTRNFLQLLGLPTKFLIKK
jgi:hypothetical protein